ncbi:unnamed protein product [Clonostachys byssicola]|uniref:Rhodopsin domain-containing protein n=1 Tax=Clonostachys byssicola TaxID=160290 RepID=A0A9N9UXU0_9HYPO|nr:unnamed protein product [Clonostachys byssicola]
MASDAAGLQGMDPYIIEALTYLAFCILLIAFRTYCRMRGGGISALGPEDYLMLVSILPFVAETTIAYKVGETFHGLTNSDMTTEEREALSPDSHEYALRVGGSKAIIGGWSMYMTLIWTLKASMCAFYLRLTSGLPGYRKRVYIGFVSIVVSYIICMCSVLLSCQPFHKFWQINPYPGNFCEPAVNKLTIHLSMYLNFLTDMYLFLIPIPMLWTAQLPKAKKIGLAVLFSGGLLTMIFGFLRGIAILKSDATGPKEGAAWACRESFVAITTTNLPMTWGWIREKLRPFLGSLISTNKSRTPKYGYGKRSGRQPGSMALDDRSENWGLSQTKATIFSEAGTGKVSTDEEAILPRSTSSMGGILKEVELSVSSSTRKSAAGL